MSHPCDHIASMFNYVYSWQIVSLPLRKDVGWNRSKRSLYELYIALMLIKEIFLLSSLGKIGVCVYQFSFLSIKPFIMAIL
jgi:hypothetical protein